MLNLATILVYSYLLVFGCCIGSFLNVVIYRLPQGKSLSKERSFCYGCGKQIKAYDLIPVLSWCILRGKCRNCKSKISVRYALVELFTGLCCVTTFYYLGFSLATILKFAFVAILICVALIDHDTMEIPNKLPISIAICSVPLFFLQTEVTVVDRLIGSVVVSLPLLIIAVLIQGGFGGGDIKLMAATGLILGWKLNLVAFVIGLLIGGLQAIILLAMKKVDRKSHTPFGPSLCIGLFIAMLFGYQLIDWYWSFL